MSSILVWMLTIWLKLLVWIRKKVSSSTIKMQVRSISSSVSFNNVDNKVKRQFPQ